MNKLMKDMLFAYIIAFISGYLLLMGFKYLTNGDMSWLETFLVLFVIMTIIFIFNYRERKKRDA